LRSLKSLARSLRNDMLGVGMRGRTLRRVTFAVDDSKQRGVLRHTVGLHCGTTVKLQHVWWSYIILLPASDQIKGAAHLPR
jgi:hypothetical protein